MSEVCTVADKWPAFAVLGLVAVLFVAADMVPRLYAMHLIAKMKNEEGESARLQQGREG